MSQVKNKTYKIPKGYKIWRVVKMEGDFFMVVPSKAEEVVTFVFNELEEDPTRILHYSHTVKRIKQ